MTDRSIPAEIALSKPSALPESAGDRSSAALEPTTLVPSRIQWWTMAVGGSVLCVISLIAVIFGGDTGAIILAAFSGFWALLGAIMLLPGANSMRVDENGFEVEHFFRKKHYRWSDVSDFAVRSVGEHNNELVSFDTTETHRSLWDKINGALIGKSGYLPNTYGMPAEDLAKFMTAWKNSATEANRG